MNLLCSDLPHPLLLAHAQPIRGHSSPAIVHVCNCTPYRYSAFMITRAPVIPCRNSKHLCHRRSCLNLTCLALNPSLRCSKPECSMLLTGSSLADGQVALLHPVMDQQKRWQLQTREQAHVTNQAQPACSHQILFSQQQTGSPCYAPGSD